MRWFSLIVSLVAFGCSSSGGGDERTEFEKGQLTQCVVDSGAAMAGCVDDYVAALASCRLDDDAECEAAAREAGGALSTLTRNARERTAAACSDDEAFAIGHFGGAEDLGEKAATACTRFGEELFSLSFSPDEAASPEERACQRVVSDALAELRASVVDAIGPGCSVLDFDRDGCDRGARDASVDDAIQSARSGIIDGCSDSFDALSLASFGANVEERVASLVDEIVNRSRNLALFAFPPNNIGPTAELGPYPVGVRTYEAVDASRPNVPGGGPRPVTFDVYYPSTDGAVEGLPRELVALLGLEILPAPVYRDVDLAEGVYPLVLFSHGYVGIRFQSLFHLAHLASHGFVVVSPDHHGNTIPDDLMDVVDEATAVNRAFDMKFLMDQLLDGGSPSGAEFAASVDPEKIGMSGHSYGGYEAFILTGGEVRGSAIDDTTVTLGTFTDPRIKAILPMAPRTMRRVDAVTLGTGFFSTVTVPTLIIGSELDMTDPFFVDAQRAFNALPIGAKYVGLAEVLGGGHNTFTDLCELQSDILDLIGGANEGCQPWHLPWKHGHDLINYLSLNFFDGILNENQEALDRLAPEVVGELEDLRYWRK